MGRLFKQKYSEPIPPNATVTAGKGGKRVAAWSVRGKKRTAPLSADGTRVVLETQAYYAEYVDGSGKTVRVSTGFTDKMVASSWLSDRERDAERERAGIVKPAERATAAHRQAPVAEHIAAYLHHMAASGRAAKYVGDVTRQLTRIVSECRLKTLADFDRHTFEAWLCGLRIAVPARGRGQRSAPRERTGGPVSNRTRNTYLVTATTFLNWCADPSIGRIAANPFAAVQMLNEKVNRPHTRRAFTLDELPRLFEAAQRRPAIDALAKLTKASKVRGRLTVPTLLPATRAKLTRLGRERALIYKTLVTTGLLIGELASLTVGQVFLSGPVAYAELEAADEKNREGNRVPLTPDLAADLSAWLADRGSSVLSDPDAIGGRSPKLFAVPDALSKILNRDLRAAGIAKRDGRGRVLDVHSFRHTFATMGATAGVPVKVLQSLMRHKQSAMTMDVYAHAGMSDGAKAMNSFLPSLPLSAGPESADLTGNLTGEACKTVQSGVRPCNGQVDGRVELYSPHYVVSA